MNMQIEKKSHFVKNPKRGISYKLWSLPIGTKATRAGLTVSGKEVKTFQIVEHTMSATYVKSDWAYVFHLDASLEATVV